MAVGGCLIASTGTGDDDVSLNNLSANRVGVFLGAGNDNLSLSNAWLWWLRADGGSGSDSITGRLADGVRTLKRELWGFETRQV